MAREAKQTEKQFRLFLFLTSLLLTTSSALPFITPPQYIKGVKLFGAGRYDEAIETFKNIIEQTPAFAPAFHKLAVACRATGDPEEAMRYFQKLAARDSTNACAWYGIGVVYEQQNDLQKALRYYRRAVHMHPAHTLPVFSLTTVYETLKKRDEAEQFLSGMLAEHPNYAPAYYGVGRIYEQQSQWEKALRYLNKASALDSSLLFAYHAMGNIYRDTGDYHKSLKMDRKGLVWAQRTGDVEYEAYFLRSLGIDHRKLRRYSLAMDYTRRAMEMVEAFGDRQKQAQMLESMGNIYGAMGEPRRALPLLQQAAEIRRKTGDIKGLGIEYSNLAIAHRKLGELQKALQAGQRALEIARQLGNRRSEGVRLQKLGIIYKEMGNFEQALLCHEKALAIAREVGDKRNQVREFCNIGIVYTHLGEYEEALSLMKQGLKLARGNGYKQSQLRLLGNIGIVFEQCGDYTNALSYFRRSLALAREIGERGSVATTLGNIGLVLAKTDDYAGAKEYYQRALEIHRQTGYKKGEAFALNGFAAASLKTGDDKDAQAAFDKALRIAQKIESPTEQWKAHAGLASVYENRGEDDRALLHYGHAVKIIEGVQSALTVEDFKAGFMETNHVVYEKMIALLAKRHTENPDYGYERQAFLVAEKAKARAFIALLAEARADVYSGVDPGLKEEEKRLQRRLAATQRRRQTPHLSKTERGRLAVSADSLERAIDLLKIRLRAGNPRYAALMHPQPLHLRKVQKHLPDEQTAIVEYFIGRNASFVWIIKKQEAFMQRLPGQRLIEQKVREFLATISRPVRLGNPFSAHISAGVELYNMLIAPVRDKLTARRLIIVPDGLLFLLPFEALVSQIDRAGAAHYLFFDFRLVYAPSATAWRCLEETSTLPERRLLAFGDPVYTSNATLASRQGAAISANNAAAIAASTAARKADRGDFYLNRLPYSGVEVKEIAALFPAAAQKVYLEENAREEVLKNEDLMRYSFIHFAAHCLLDQQRPGCSSIVLTQDDDPAEDGFLQVNEILNLKLHADLVVLSACQTGLGRLRKGEGIIGLARAFMYAGSSSVLVSLWNINDGATADLMRQFYTCLAKGVGKSESLRLAKLAMLQSPRRLYSHPYYWASFVLIGNDR